MRPHLAPALALTAALLGPALPSRGADKPLPRVAKDWSIEAVVAAPKILYPTAIVVAPDGMAYLGQDPMDMPGPPTSPIDSVVAIRGSKVATFAEGLWSVMGLEWLDGTLFVVHAPFLSAFRDTDGDGKADRRVDLVTGLGPKVPGFNGINDHIASGLRLGMDGFLYVAVGDKGIPKALGRDGRTIAMATGGVIRVRPDGTGLEVVSTGERNPLSVALSASDDIFTLGNDDDSHKWPNSLTHHIVGGHHGYPYEFLLHPERALPIVAGLFGGAGAQGVAINEAGLPARFRGNLVFCDWGAQTVERLELARAGATFSLKSREPLVEKGDLADFRPFSIATEPGGSSFLLVDWGFNGWLASGPRTGRVFRLTYTGPDRVAKPPGAAVDPVAGLDHPALAERLRSQRSLAAQGKKAVPVLALSLGAGRPSPARIHAIWALDAIGSPEARSAIESSLKDPDPAVRLQAARSLGIRKTANPPPGLKPLLRDPDPSVRREAAIALGRLGDPSAAPELYEALGEADRFASWSIVRAIRDLGAWDVNRLTAALSDPSRRENALRLAEESWSIPAVRALNANFSGTADPAWRARVAATLAGLYRRYPEWSGRWFGTNPLAGSRPRKTADWAPEGMDAVLDGLTRAVRDPDPLVRRPAIDGLVEVGARAVPPLRAALVEEQDPINLANLARGLGAAGDASSVGPLAQILLDPGRPTEARSAALDALARLNSPDSLRARMSLVFDQASPEMLVARALPPLGRTRALPSGDLVEFLYRKSEDVRAAALGSFATGKALPPGIRVEVVDRLTDPSARVRKAAIEAVATHQVREAIPRLLTLAAEEPDRADATRALAGLPDPRGVPVYASALRDRDPELRRAGTSALLAIKDEAAGELAAMARKGQFAGPSALAVERILGKFAPVAAWKVIGPFPRTGSALFPDSSKIDFGRPADGAAGRPVTWQGRKADPASGRLALDPLAGPRGDLARSGFEASSPADLSAFAYAEVASEADRPALLLVESAGSIAVAVNDRAAAPRSAGEGTGAIGDPAVVRVALKKGVNRILVWSRQGVAGWSFALQVSQPSALPLAGLPGSAGLEGLRTFALSHGGDPKNGEALFFQTGGIGCARCHAVGGQGAATVGPDLAGLGAKYDKAEIVRSVLEPSDRIAGGYQVITVARSDGSVASGILRGEDDSHLDLVDASGQAVRVEKSRIDRRGAGEASLMPSGLVDSLTPVEFADLIAYLAGLRSR